MSTKNKYRVNFGNGQVHYAGSLTDCVRLMKEFGDGFTFIQYQDGYGEWHKVQVAK